MAAYHNPEIQTKAAENHLELTEAKQRGLGLGLDVTNPNPWGHKTSFEVRRNVTADNIPVICGPCKVNHYSRLVVNNKDLIFNADARAFVKPSKSVWMLVFHASLPIRSKSSEQECTLVQCPLIIPGDTTETSFDRELRKEMKFDSRRRPIHADAKGRVRKFCKKIRYHTLLDGYYARSNKITSCDFKSTN